MSMKTNNLYDFADFRIDEKERVLIADGEIIPLAPKVFDTLFSIVKRRGSIISKEELMDEVWSDSFVEESNLTQNIYTLRQTLGKENKFIETVPRRGYRFIKPVEITQQDLASNAIGSIKKLETAEIGTTETPVKTHSSILSKKYLTIFAAAIVAIGATAVWFSKNNRAEDTDLSAGPISFQSITDSGDVLSLAVSEHGKLLAYVARDEEAGKSLKLLDIQAKQAVKLDVPKELNFSAITFSPDSNFLYFLSRKGADQAGDIYRITRFGGTPKLVASDVWSEFSISADGKKTAFYRRNPETNEQKLVVRYLENSQKENIVAKRSFPEGFSFVSPPTWFPDGKKLIINVKPQKRHFSTLSIVNLQSGKEKPLETPQLKIIVYAQLMPDGDNLIIAGREPNRYSQIYKLTISTKKFVRITNDVSNYREISLSTDGESLVAKRSSSYSNLWHIPGTNLNVAKQLTFGQKGRDARHGLEFLPSGKILYVSLAGNNRDLWTIDPANKSRRQLTENMGDVNEHPSVSSNGDKIYFNVNDPTKNNSFLI